MSDQNIRSITFFYPSTIVGGAEFLYIRLARFISDTTNIPVFVIDYDNGFLRKSLAGSKVNIIIYRDGYENLIDFDTTIITPLSHIFKTQDFRVNSPNVKVLFWSIHPTHLTNYLLNRNWFLSENSIKIIGREVTALINAGSLVFMDFPNYIENQNKLHISFEKEDIVYLPICCDDYDGDLHKYKEGSKLKICWLGRIAEDKVSSIENFVWHLQQLPFEVKKKLKFVCIGNGSEENRLKFFLEECDIETEWKGTIVGDDLNEYLVNEVDVGVAMGTSLLEFAKLKIPAIMVDIMPSNYRVYDNRFNWLSESSGYSVGDIYNQAKQYNHKLSDMIKQLQSEDSYVDIANACYHYYRKNHSLASVAKQLIEEVSKVSMPLINKHTMEIYSLMNPWYFLLGKRVKRMLLRS